MADNYPRPDDVASILEHPALDSLGEFLHEVHEAESIARFTENRFMGHEPDIALQIDNVDPGEIEAIRQRRYEAYCQRYDMRGAQRRTFHRQRRGGSAYENTSLDDTAPELASARPPRQCRSHGTEQIDLSELVSDFIENRLELLQEESEQREAEKIADAKLDRLVDTLAATRREIPGLKMKIQALADDFCAKDEKSFRKWESHLINAHKCSKAPSRVWSIAMLYQKGLPKELWRAVRDLAACELSIAADTLRFKTIQVIDLDTEGVSVPCCGHHTYCNDETWHVQMAEDFTEQDIAFFGSDHLVDVPNGISDYLAPAGSSIQELTQHMMANLETRKICHEHAAKAVDRTALIASFAKFTDRVQNAVDVEMHKLLGGDWFPAPDELEQAEADRQALVGVQKAIRAARADLGLPLSDDLGAFHVQISFASECQTGRCNVQQTFPSGLE